MVDQINNNTGHIYSYKDLTSNRTDRTEKNTSVDSSTSPTSRMEDSLQVRADNLRGKISQYENNINNLQQEYQSYDTIKTSLNTINELQKEFAAGEQNDERRAEFQTKMDEELANINSVIEDSKENANFTLRVDNNLASFLEEGVVAGEENKNLNNAVNDVDYRRGSVESRIESQNNAMARFERNLAQVEEGLESVSGFNSANSLLDELKVDMLKNIGAGNISDYYMTNYMKEFVSKEL